MLSLPPSAEVSSFLVNLGDLDAEIAARKVVE